MKKIACMFVAVLLTLIIFTGCPFPCECDHGFYGIVGLKSSLNTEKLVSDGIITVNLKGTPKVNSKEKKNFDFCSVKITVVNEGNANVKITELVSSTNPAYKEWKYYDNDKEKLEVVDIRGSYDLSPETAVDDEIVIKVNETKDFYICIDFELKREGYYVAEEYYKIRLK